MGSARKERDIMAGCGHARAVITADGTRRHDREPHLRPSAGKISLSKYQ